MVRYAVVCMYGVRRGRLFTASACVSDDDDQ